MPTRRDLFSAAACIAAGNVLLKDAVGAGQNPADLGFERRPPTGLTTASYIYYAFTTDEKRAAAHAKWKEWAAANLKK